MGGRLGGEGVRYIDDAVARRVDRNGDGEFSGANSDNFFYLTDMMFSVRAIVDGAGRLHTRLDYTPCGVAMHGFAADVNGDGVLSFTDLVAFNTVYNSGTALRPGTTGYDPDADLSGSGSMDSDDSAAFAARYTAYAAGGSNPTFNDGWIDNPSDPNGPDNSAGYDGYWFDLAGATEATSSGLYMVRYRVYDPRLGRWLQRDPLGYVDGTAVYSYVGNDPLSGTDPSGTKTIKGDEAAIISWIGAFSPRAYAAATTSFEMYGDPTYMPPLTDPTYMTWDARSFILVSFYGLLRASANPTPPVFITPTNGPSNWGSREHRGYLTLSPVISCCNGNAQRGQATSSVHPGWTPVFRSRLYKYYYLAETHPTINGGVVTTVNGSCVQFVSRSASRVDTPAQLGSAVFFGSNLPGYIYREIIYSLCCDGTSRVSYGGSLFPSHRAYFAGQSIATATQSNPWELFYAGNSQMSGRVFHTR